MKTKVLFKSLILFYFLHLGNLLAQEPYLDWAYSIGGSISNDFGQSIGVDNQGNVYSTGIFEGTVDFDPSSNVFNLTSSGNRDIYIQKCDENGNLIWVKHFGAAHDDQPRSLVVDNLGNIYSTGIFLDTVDFNPGVDTFNLISSGGFDIYIQKLDTDGNFIWAKKIGGSLSNYSSRIKLDEVGNVYTTGNFQGTVDFNPGSGIFNLTSNGDRDIFISKLTSNGDFVWTKSFGGSSDDFGSSIAIDEFGSVYSLGYFSDTVDFDPGIGTNTSISNGMYDIYIEKLDSNGNFIWIKTFGGSEHDHGIDLYLDGSENIYTTGYFKETVDFDPGINILNKTSNGSDDIYMQKLDTNGNLIWIKTFGGSLQDKTRSITLDSFGHVYATGFFSGNVDFDPGSGVESIYSFSGGPDSFLEKLDSNGNFISASRWGGTNSDRGNNLVIDNSNNILITGYFGGTADFDPGPDDEVIGSQGYYDAYVLKLYQCTPTTLDFDVSNLPNLTAQCSLDTLIPPTVSNGCVSFEGTTTTTLPLVNQGSTVITWNYDDGNGNTLSQDQTVVINDETNPIPDTSSLPSISALCEVSTTDAPTPTGTDNCTEVTVNSNTSFPITDQNINEIVWTYEDGHGNTTTQTQTITWGTLDVTTALNGFTITANNSNATYQWLNCSNNSPIAGQSNASFTATANGEYAVEITENGCIDTSACVTIEGIGLNELDGLTLAVYPNPSKQVFNIKFEKPVEYAQLKVTNLLGKTVYTKTIEHDIEIQIDLKDQASGLYLLHILTNSGQKTVELIKE